jgi:hypothetical protein
MRLSIFLVVAMLSVSSAVADQAVYFISPQDGETLSGQFDVRFGLRGMGVAPAGVDQANTGHHHLLIDVEAMPAMDVPLPSTEQIRHFGGGQTETSLKLAPGTHTLQLLLGNYSHIPHNPPVVSEKITIIVTE